MLRWLERLVPLRRATPREWRVFVAALGVLALVDVADVWTTMRALSTPRLVEYNPIWALAAAHGGWPVLVAGKAATFVASAALGWLGMRWAPRAMLAVLLLGLGLVAGAAAWNAHWTLATH